MSLFAIFKRNQMTVETYPCQVCGKGGVEKVNSAHGPCREELNRRLDAMSSH